MRSRQRLVVIDGPIMDYQFALREEETVGLYFPGRRNYFLHLFRRQLWQVVDKLPCVRRVGYDKAKLEIIGPYDFTAEVMPLHHLHMLNSLRTNAKVKSEPNRLQMQEFWPQMILNDSRRRVIIVANLVINVLLRHFDEHDVGHAISDPESAKLKGRPVV